MQSINGDGKPVTVCNGFLFPDEIIEGPYNISFNDKKMNPISIEALIEQAQDIVS